MVNHSRRLLILILVWCLLAVQTTAWAQSATAKEPQTTRVESETPKTGEVDSPAEQRRTFVISQLISLADEARSYHDLALRPHVLASAADTLWDADSDTARRIFRRAWEAAEVADAETLAKKIDDPQMQMVASLRRMSGVDTRNEVLRTAARRDRALGEEFLAKLKDQTERSSNAAGRQSPSEDLARRLRLARNLLDDGQIDQAIAFAAPALYQVNLNSIGFLSALRVKRPEIADQRFAVLLAQAELDPASDANTVSGLASYAFTPAYYITFKPDGGATWSFGEATLAPPNLPLAIRNAFFKVAANILLRPLPPPQQDYTTSGRLGKYMVIKRLLPLFDQDAPDSATALRAQLGSLTTELPRNATADQNRVSQSLVEGLKPREPAGNILGKMQDRLDNAKTSKERDSICKEVASELADQGDARAQDVAEKIDDSDLRNKVRGYVDFQLVRFALKKPDATEAVRRAKTGQLTHLQRVWVYIQAARLLNRSQRSPSLDLLEEAIVEARRIDAADEDRARALFAVATQFVAIDVERTWEIIGEAVKAANSAEKFTGEDTSIRNFPVMLKTGGTFESVSDKDFGISNALRSLAKGDLNRSMEVAKSFEKDGPRAVAILAIAGAVLEESKTNKENESLPRILGAVPKRMRSNSTEVRTRIVGQSPLA